MGEALLRGALRAGARPADLAVVEGSTVRLGELRSPGGVGDRHPGLAVAASLADLDLAPGYGAVLAVKPGDVATAAGQLASAGGGPGRVLSVAAGVTLERLRSLLDGPALLRAMPNTPALVGAGASALAAAPGTPEADVAWAEGLLGAVGLCVRVGEHLLDAVTGLSGSGPAYVFLVAEALTDAGVLVGLPRATARDLCVQTLLGAARMLDETGDSAEVLRAAVTSPGGTTAAGLQALENRAVRAALADAVVAATDRSRQLGA
jgi:pyrroline-5-carboxylate reductase